MTTLTIDDAFLSLPRRLGLCSTFAAIAAGRCGAKTVVIERFGTLGGNIGPGMLVMGSLYGEAETSLPGGLAGIAKEFIHRLQQLHARGKTDRASVNRGYPYAEESNIVSYLAYDMMTSAGVEIILHAYASDPIMEDGVVKGLFVETMSGRVAVNYWYIDGQNQRLSQPFGTDIMIPGYECDLNPEELFVNGDTRLKRVCALSELGPKRWYFDYAAARIYLHDDPSSFSLIETSATSAAFGGSGIKNVLIENLVIEKYGNPPISLVSSFLPSYQRIPCHRRCKSDFYR